jgi:hypothetical protein
MKRPASALEPAPEVARQRLPAGGHLAGQRRKVLPIVNLAERIFATTRGLASTLTRLHHLLMQTADIISGPNRSIDRHQPQSLKWNRRRLNAVLKPAASAR